METTESSCYVTYGDVQTQTKPAPMKAYKAWDATVDSGSTVVFAENLKAAKKIAACTEVCEDSEWIDIRVKRYPEMDQHYRGNPEIDWYDPEDRQALVALGWTCYEPLDDECEACPAFDICNFTHWRREEEGHGDQ